MPSVLLDGHDALEWFVCPSLLLGQAVLHSVCSVASCVMIVLLKSISPCMGHSISEIHFTNTVVVRIIGTLGKYQRRLWKLICIVNPFDLLFKNSQKSNLSLDNRNFKWGGNNIMKLNVFL